VVSRQGFFQEARRKASGMVISPTQSGRHRHLPCLSREKSVQPLASIIVGAIESAASSVAATRPETVPAAPEAGAKRTQS